MKTQTNRTKPKNFRFLKHANIGAYDARDDRGYLQECFIDTGDLNHLKNLESPMCIIVGRTGCGKTALIERLVSEEQAIVIDPDDLALNYVSNNQVLRFFAEAGVKMDLFYRQLWRHVFVTEIIKAHYRITNETVRDEVVAQLRQMRDRFRNKKAKQEALDYLIQFNNSFWKDSDYRTREVTETFQSNLEKSVKGKVDATILGGLGGAVEGQIHDGKNLTTEKRAEVVKHGQAVVDNIQLKKLSDLLDLLEDEIITDNQKKYYIAIDRLDEGWVNDDLRYHLIRALLETVKDINKKLSAVKIVLALREDLIDRVFRHTRDSGYQEEKYRSQFLQLSWTAEELESLLNCRIGLLVREQYTNEAVLLRDLLPSKINREDPAKYILDRTLMRPRDAIAFLNECIRAAEGKATITQENVFTAEANYSSNRLRALADEWNVDYKNLIEMSFLLKKFPAHFKVHDIYADHFNRFALDFLTANGRVQDEIYELIALGFNDSTQLEHTLYALLRILYRVGIVGVKPESYMKTYWSFTADKLVTSENNPESTYSIYPAFFRVLGVRT